MAWRAALVLTVVFSVGMTSNTRVLLGGAGALFVAGLVHRPARRVWRWLLAAVALAYLTPSVAAGLYGDGLAATLLAAGPAGVVAATRDRSRWPERVEA